MLTNFYGFCNLRVVLRVEVYFSFFLPVGSRGLDVQAKLFHRAIFAVSFATTPFAGLSRCYDEIYPISRRRQEDSVASLPGLFGRLSNGETEV